MTRQLVAPTKSENDRERDIHEADDCSSQEENPQDSPATVEEDLSEAESEHEPWGFIAYRTVYGDEAEWQAFREKLDYFIDKAREPIVSYNVDPDGLLLKFIEDEATLEDLLSQQIRL